MKEVCQEVLKRSKVGQRSQRFLGEEIPSLSLHFPFTSLLLFPSLPFSLSLPFPLLLKPMCFVEVKETRIYQIENTRDGP